MTVPEEPYRQRILDALILDVKPYGGVWCDGDRLSVRYMPYGDHIYMRWCEAAALTGIEVPSMKAAVRKKLQEVRNRQLRAMRKPPERETTGPVRKLTLEQIAEAKKEAAAWHKREQSTGLGRSLLG